MGFSTAPPAGRCLRILLLKPSHYDDDGYVVQWFKAHIPGHTMGVVHGILVDAGCRGVPEPGVGLEILPMDEFTGVLPHRRLIRWLRGAERGVVMLVGVQTTQYPRALDLARPYRAAGIPVVMGGFHVSGCLSMVPDWQPGLEEARREGIILYAGELEAGVDTLLGDLWAGRPQPLYNLLSALPDLTNAPMPHLHLSLVRQTLRQVAGFDLGRGCPFRCSFCTIINVHGNVMRQRGVAATEAYFRHCAANGIRYYLFADDNLSRSPGWEELFDLLARLRGEGIPMDFFMQVDTRAHRIPRFVEKARAAGCTRVFIGIESVRPGNLASAGKRHNQVAALREMGLAWKRVGMMVIGAYMVGFPEDTPGGLAQDIGFLQGEVAVDALVVSLLTPLPGSRDHRELLARGAWLDGDLNNYDVEHVVMEHPRMAAPEWRRAFYDAYHHFYTWEHMERVLKRALATGTPAREVLQLMVGFYGDIRFEGLHPYQGGLIRRKVWRLRRPGLPREPLLPFLARRLGETVAAQWGFFRLWWRLNRILRRARRQVAREGYSDGAIGGDVPAGIPHPEG